MRRLICLLAAGLLMAACGPDVPPQPTLTPMPLPSPTAPSDTAWGPPTVITEATGIDAPALATDGRRTRHAAFERIGGRAELVMYLDAERVPTGIGGTQPFALTLHPSANSGWVALWLDQESGGTQKLYTVRLGADGRAAQGVQAVSSGAVTRYAAASLPDHSLWAVWSTPVAGEPALIGSRIDSAGRARTPQSLRIDADFPALTVTAGGNVLLYWLDGTGQVLHGAEVTDAGLTRSAAISVGRPTAPAEHLHGLSAGLDTTHAYFFWHILTAAGENQTWWLTVPLADTSDGGDAQLLRLTPTDETAQTGFNHGTAYGAHVDHGGLPVAWASPVGGQNDTLPVAALIDGVIGMLYFRDGGPVAVQRLGVRTEPLIAPPRAITTDERDLVLSWWRAGTREVATLYSVRSRR